MAVFDNFPYTNVHELNMDWLIKSTGEVKQLADDTAVIAEQAEKLLEETNELVEDLDSRIDTLVEEEVVQYLDESPTIQEAIDEAVETQVKHVHVMDPDGYCIYVSATTGTDDNDGLAPSRPIQTLDKAFEIMNKKAAGVWIYLQESGNYYITKRYICACTFHLVARAPGVTIYWGNDPSSTLLLAMYNVYIHLEGYADNSTRFYLNGTNATGCYLEAGKIYASRITFESAASTGKIWSTTGAFGTYTGCTFKTKVIVSLGSTTFSECVFEPAVNSGSDAAVACSTLSRVRFSSNATFQNISAPDCQYLVKTDCASVIFTGEPILSNITGAPDLVYADRSTFTGNQAIVQRWLGTGSGGHLHWNNVVLGKWYPSETYQAGYNDLMLVETAAKNTLYTLDKNAKALAFRFRLYSGDSNLAAWSEYIDLSFHKSRSATATMEWNSTGMWYRHDDIESGTPTYHWIRYQTKHDNETDVWSVQFTNNYYLKMGDTATHSGTYEVRVEIREIF